MNGRSIEGFNFQAVQGPTVTERKVGAIRQGGLGVFNNLVNYVYGSQPLVFQFPGIGCWRVFESHYLPGGSWDTSVCYLLSHLSKGPRFVYIYCLCIYIEADREK